MAFRDSELILNADGGIYHLNLLPEDIATTIILVGDPDRVPLVSQHFDQIELIKQKREFLTHTGYLNSKRLSVISTGIGAGSIDIVLNELDALVNIDFTTKKVKTTKTTLDIIRIGTSGTIQPDIDLDSFVLSQYAMGYDGLLHFYERNTIAIQQMEHAFYGQLGLQDFEIPPYTTSCNEMLKNRFDSNRIRFGITLTNLGFYGPQGRFLRLTPRLKDVHKKLSTFNFQGLPITNFEMETAPIYGLSQLLGHRAVSLNAILANRTHGTFSTNPTKTIKSLILFCLEQLMK